MKRNLAANFAGTAWVALLQVALVPVFIRLLGIEAYGLIGFYTTLQTIFVLFDAGLGTAANRELAQRSILPDAGRRAESLVRTLEVVYAGIAVVLGAVIWLAAPLIAARWVTPQSLTVAAVTTAIRLMGCVMAAQFPFALYSGVLLGLQRHVTLNSALAAGSALRLLGALPILLYVSRTVSAFFAWQVLATACQTLFLRTAAIRACGPHPGEPTSRRDFGEIRSLRGFAAGITGVATLSAIVMQLDKIAVSRLAPLSALGYYTVASTMAGAASLVAAPVFATVFPRLSQLHSAGDEAEFARLFHRSAQTLSAFLLPICAMLAMFPNEILRLWTRDADVAANAGPLLAILALGTACNGIQHVPYAAQLARGWTTLAFGLNLVGVLVVAPAVFMAAKWNGARGAAAVIAAWHLTALVVGNVAMYHRMLRGEQWKWLLIDIGIPAVTAAAVCALGRRLAAIGAPAAGGVELLVVAAMVFAATVVVTPIARQWMGELQVISRKDSA